MLLTTVTASAQIITVDQDDPDEQRARGWIPYVFATDALETAFGVGGGISGLGGQRQTSLLGTVMATSNQSGLLSGAFNSYRIPGTERLFLDAFGQVSHFTDDRVYADVDADPGTPRAGSNDSDEDDFLSGITNDYQFEIGLKYPLAIGDLRDDPVSTYTLDDGLLVSDSAAGRHWNPLKSGRTVLGLTLFSRYRDIDDDVNDPDNETLFYETNGLELQLEHDNTDFSRNPSRGSRQKFTVARDFGWFDSTNSWTSWQLDLAKYFDLGSSGRFRQRVLAMNFWTSDSPTWEQNAAGPPFISNRPPGYRGSSLGGFDRLRAYPDGRFNDKSAAYYSAELRVIPKWNPLGNLRFLDFFEIDWWQIVGFVEAGRVNDSYDADLLTEDLKYDAGVGLRLMTFQNIARLDFAYGEEGGSVWAMYAQPFAR